jgi:hypothetical protein
MTKGRWDIPYVSRFARRVGQPPLLYPNGYVWLVFASSLDFVLTWLILGMGGAEVNPIADAVLATSGYAGMMGYKFALMTLFIVICEIVGRRKRHVGRRLAMVGVAITTVPIVWSFALLIIHAKYLND